MLLFSCVKTNISNINHVLGFFLSFWIDENIALTSTENEQTNRMCRKKKPEKRKKCRAREREREREKEKLSGCTYKYRCYNSIYVYLYKKKKRCLFFCSVQSSKSITLFIKLQFQTSELVCVFSGFGLFLLPSKFEWRHHYSRKKNW